MADLIVSVSGIRGVVGTGLTPVVAAKFGMAYGTLLGAGKCVLVGRDTRPSGQMVRDALVSGLLAAGLKVTDLGIAATPTTSLMIRHVEADGGAMVTASHNPIVWNGIKFFDSAGLGVSPEFAGRLGDLLKHSRYELADVHGLYAVSTDDTAADAHVARVLEACDRDLIASKRFRVALDSVNGAGCIATPTLLAELGCELVHVYGEPSGRFEHPPEPLKVNLTRLCDLVREHRANVGFAQDPDADRLAIVDENGTYIGEEYTPVLGTRFALTLRKGPIVANLSTTRLMDDIAAEAGVELHRTAVGERNVVSRMLEVGAVAGGEGGGGFIYPAVVPTRDSLTGMAFMLQYMASTGRTVSELVAELPVYHVIKRKFPCTPKKVDGILAEVAEAFADQRIDRTDGVRIDWPDGWALVRPSNTEPIARLQVEAVSSERAAEIAGDVQDAIDNAGRRREPPKRRKA
jgi:phosphomannomutase